VTLRPDRTTRRRRRRQWALEAGRRELAKRPTIVGEFAFRGRKGLYVTIEPHPDWPPAIVQAWRDREQANTTGRCPCGARIALPLPSAPGLKRATMDDHAAGCLVIDENYIALVGEWVLGGRS
jgi:hypothetical protein